MLVSLVSLKEGNVKKSKELTKIVNMEEENLHIVWSSMPLQVKKSSKPDTYFFENENLHKVVLRRLRSNDRVICNVRLKKTEVNMNVLINREYRSLIRFCSFN